MTMTVETCRKLKGGENGGKEKRRILGWII